MKSATKSVFVYTLISKSQRSWDRVKRFIEDSLSALQSLKSSKATNDSVARVSRGTRRGFDFELREPNPKLKSACIVWQISWFTIVWPWEIPYGNEYENTFFDGVSFWVISDRYGQEGQNWLLCLILYDKVFSYKLLNQEVWWTPKPLARQITTLFFLI